MPEVKEATAFGVPAKSRAAGKPVSHLAPVPMFDPMLQSARDMVQSLNWFRREIGHADNLCTNMEQVTEELLASKIAEDAAKHVQAAVAKLRANVTKVSGFCQRLELLTAELQGGMDTDFEMPETYRRVGVAHE